MKTEQQIKKSLEVIKKQSQNKALPKVALQKLSEAVKILEWVLE